MLKEKVKEVIDRLTFGDKWADKEFAYKELGLEWQVLEDVLIVNTMKMGFARNVMKLGMSM